VSADSAPQWPTREETLSVEKLVRRSQRISTRSKIILALGIVVFATGVFLMGGEKKRSESQMLLEEKIQQLQAKEQRVQTLEAELEKVRRELKDNSNHLAELKTKLEESQKNLASTQTRLGQATREMDRLASSRPQAAAKTSSRRTGAAASSSPPPTRRAAEPGSYETLRPTSVHAEPSESSRVVSQIRRGTRVTVVRSVGDWLEVKSKYGNPPGFIRSDDTMFVGAAN
jgi:uncharacterized membrane-anchored protein YhcB (DUF1043 family)